MPILDDHCRRCIEVLGEDFKEVHLWLDEFYGKPPWGSRHRSLRHHKQGIEEIRQLYGDGAAQAAEIHIRQDLDEEGWPEDKPIPRDSDEYRSSGLW